MAEDLLRFNEAVGEVKVLYLRGLEIVRIGKE
jgi:hypothetical protein